MELALVSELLNYQESPLQEEHPLIPVSMNMKGKNKKENSIRLT